MTTNSTNFNLSKSNYDLQQDENILSNDWHRFIQDDTAYWQNHDVNKDFFTIQSEKGTQNFFLILSLVANLLLDFLLFHNLADYFIRLMLPGAVAWMVLTAACFFPLCYMAIEFKFAYFIDTAKQNQRNDPYDRWLISWVILWYLLGLCWAVLPGAVFAYIMTLAQAESQLSWILIGILTILGVLLHLSIVFGGEPVINAKNCWYARRQERALRAKRFHSNRVLGKQARRTKSIASHYAMLAKEQNMAHYFIGLSEEAIFIIKFVDGGCYPLHPFDRPMAYRYGIYRCHQNIIHLPQGNPLNSNPIP